MRGRLGGGISALRGSGQVLSGHGSDAMILVRETSNNRLWAARIREPATRNTTEVSSNRRDWNTKYTKYTKKERGARILTYNNYILNFEYYNYFFVYFVCFVFQSLRSRVRVGPVLDGLVRSVGHYLRFCGLG
jgi:hypothetical protein